jgi:hypothetical protein
VSTRGPRDSTAFEVREALGEPGCVVCGLGLRSVARALSSIAYEQVNDVTLREGLRRSHGFCNEHAFQWLREVGNVLGTALIYRDVLVYSLNEIQTMRPGRLRSLVRPSSAVACPACRAQAEAETRYTQALLAVVAEDAAARGTFSDSDGVCRRHALLAARLGGSGATLVLQRTREVAASLLADLEEVIRKEDYRFRHEPRTAAERTAPARAVAWAAGADGLTG